MGNQLDQTFFSLKSSYQSEAYEIQKSLFFKEKSKFLLIKYKDRVISKIHHHILEDEFESSLALFESNELNLPEEFNASYIEVIVKYFYLKEINQIPLFDIFDLLKISFYLNIDKLTNKILEFLKENLNERKKAFFLRSNSYEFIYTFKTIGQKLIQRIIDDCNTFLIKNNHYEEFLAEYTMSFLEKFADSKEEIFESTLKMLKLNQAPNDKIFQFINIFKPFEKSPLSTDKMMKYIGQFKQGESTPLSEQNEQKDEKLVEESNFQRIIEENLEITKISPNNLQYLNPSSCSILQINNVNKSPPSNSKIVESNNGFLMENLQDNFSVYHKKITHLETENLILKRELEKTRLDFEIFKSQFEEKTIIEFKNLKTQIEKKLKADFEGFQAQMMIENSEIKTNMKDLNRSLLFPDKISHFFFIHFPQFSEKELLFDSTKDERDDIYEKIEGKKDVVFLIEIAENHLLFGAYYSIPMPHAKEVDTYWKDDNSCLFEVNSNRLYKANKNQERHLRINKKYFYFGNTLNYDGIWIESPSRKINYGKKTDQFEGECTFGFSGAHSSDVSKITVYQLKDKF